MAVKFDGIDRVKAEVIEGKCHEAFTDIDGAKWGLLELKRAIKRFERGLSAEERERCAGDLDELAIHMDTALESLTFAWEVFGNCLPADPAPRKETDMERTFEEEAAAIIERERRAEEDVKRLRQELRVLSGEFRSIAEDAIALAMDEYTHDPRHTDDWCEPCEQIDEAYHNAHGMERTMDTLDTIFGALVAHGDVIH